MAETAPDGSPVAVYVLLPERGEGELVARAVPPGSTVLELGCGTGRITRQLVAHGLRVVAVDESPEMLGHVSGAETVQAQIEGLDLRRRFDAVLLASHLLTVEPERRRSFLETCRRHAPLLVAEILPPGWQPQDGREGQLGEVSVRFRIQRFEDGVVDGDVEYAVHGRTWTQAVSMRVFADEAEVAEALGEAGLTFDRWLDRERGWFTAVADIAG